MQKTEPAPEAQLERCRQCAKPCAYPVKIEGFMASFPGEPGDIVGAFFGSWTFCSVACATATLEGYGRKLGRNPSDFAPTE